MHPVLKIMHMLNFLDTFSMGITTILMTYLLRWSSKVEDIVGCTHFLVEVEYAQLEVELNTPVIVTP